MHTQRTFLDALILSYCGLLAAAFFVAMTHRFPTVLRGPILFAYGMIAPYQGASNNNTELVLVGYQDSGVATIIDLDGYFPGLHGERNARQNFDMLAETSIEKLAPFYGNYVSQIFDHEKAKGNMFTHLELIREQWPKSVEGYREGRADSVQRTFLLRYP